MHNQILCQAGFCNPRFKVDGRRVFVIRKDGIVIDLGEFDCPRHMHKCNVLGCPVHTPESSWPVVHRIETYVTLEANQQVVAA